MKVLVLYKALWGRRELKQSVLDHLNMFDGLAGSKDIIYWNVVDGVPSWLSKMSCDVVVLHTTLLSLRYGSEALYVYFRKRLQWMERDNTLKLAFPQDERYFNEYLQDWLNALGGSVHLYSVFGKDSEVLNKIYPKLSSKVTVMPCLTGYISDYDLSIEASDWQKRRLDILYRAKRLPPWVGRYGQLKTKIAEELIRICQKTSLNTDVSIEKKDIFLGRDWMNVLRESKYLIGCEAGGSALDPNGLITKFSNQVKTRTGRFPSFNEIDDQFSKDWDGHEFRAMGPKNLEAVVSKTCQVLVAGEYSGVLVANRHYIPVKEDLSDLDDVLSALNDERGQQIAETAYQEIALNKVFTYQGFISEVSDRIRLENPTAIINEEATFSVLYTRLCVLLNVIFDRFPKIFSLPHLAKLWMIQKMS